MWSSIVENGQKRAVIENVQPEVDGGRYPAKRTVNERVVVEADIFTDGHDAVSAVLLYRRKEAAEWTEAPMLHVANDRWQASFSVGQVGAWVYTIEAWVDRFVTWRRDMTKRIEAAQDMALDYRIGAELIEHAAAEAEADDRQWLLGLAKRLAGTIEASDGRTAVLDPALSATMSKYPDRTRSTRYVRELAITVDPVRARFSAWYEFFPRSSSKDGHGSFKDCERWLPYIASMGFDVLYLPPIHPIGSTFRKGRNNSVQAQPGDAGSPWAIGGAEGGHKSIHPQLGSLEDFRSLVRAAERYGIAMALDVAFQVSPDHPYVAQHAEWFRRRPDGSIQYAENPPKKYQDIYPFDFETEAWEPMWHELKSVFLYWVEQGVKIFRVDNPHTKAFPFWEWVIAEVKEAHPDVLFLSEAFTRPKVMYRLAKVGFSQSYTYFPWRHTKSEIINYFTELTQTPVREYFRPNHWPNTPDILTEFLQTSGRSGFMLRFLLASMLGANYGIYGPAFEQFVNQPVRPGSEEYLDSEKYEVHHWDLENPDSMAEFIGLVNRIRRDNLALQNDHSLRFHAVDNDHLLCFTKQSPDASNLILAVINLDPHHTHSGFVELPLSEFGLEDTGPFQAHELITGARYIWHGPRNYVEVDPSSVPAQVFRVLKRMRTEQQFEYFL